jgi:hypothetical protein
MEPIKLIKIETKEIEDDGYFDDMITKYEPVYEYDDNDNETQVGIKIIDSCQYDQESADKDWKQVLQWIKEDEARMDAYGYDWYMFGIQAVATLHFPMRNTESSIIQRIRSPGIYGIESDTEDYEKEFFKQNEEVEIVTLLDMLENMHVDVPDDFVCKMNVSDSEITVGEIKKGFGR